MATKGEEGEPPSIRHPEKAWPSRSHPSQLRMIRERRNDDVHGNLRKRADFWGAYVPDLPGVISAGDTREEVECLIQKAIQFHLEGMRDEGLPIPAPSSFAGVVEINPAA